MANNTWDRQAFETSLALLSDARGNTAVAAASVLRALSVGFRYAAPKVLADVVDAAQAAIDAAPKTERATWGRAVMALAGGVTKDAKGAFLINEEGSMIEKVDRKLDLRKQVKNTSWQKGARQRASAYAAYLEGASGYAGALKIKAAPKTHKTLDDATAGKSIGKIVEQLAPHEPLRRQLIAALESCGLPIPGKLAS